MTTDIEHVAYTLAQIAGAPWRVNVVRQLAIIRKFYTLKA